MFLYIYIHIHIHRYSHTQIHSIYNLNSKPKSQYLRSSLGDPREAAGAEVSELPAALQGVL